MISCRAVFVHCILALTLSDAQDITPGYDNNDPYYKVDVADMKLVRPSSFLVPTPHTH